MLFNSKQLTSKAVQLGILGVQTRALAIEQSEFTISFYRDYRVQNWKLKWHEKLFYSYNSDFKDTRTYM